MIKDNKLYINRINKIDNLLKNNELFDEYISNIDKRKIDIPNNLNDKILLKINNENIQKSKNLDKRVKYYDILKIAACTVFAIFVWETNISTNFKTKEDFKPRLNMGQVYSNVNNVFKDINSFLMTPHSVIKGE